MSYTEKFYYNSVEKIEIVLYRTKISGSLLRTCIVTWRNTVRYTLATPHYDMKSAFIT